MAQIAAPVADKALVQSKTRQQLASAWLSGRSDPLSVDIARWRITADQIIRAPGRMNGAADVSGRRPDQLCVVGDVMPVSRRRNEGKDAGPVELPLRDPQADHLLGRE